MSSVMFLPGHPTFQARGSRFGRPSIHRDRSDVERCSPKRESYRQERLSESIKGWVLNVPSSTRVSRVLCAPFSTQEVHRMSKRYPTLNAMGSETAVPLLSWLAEELGMNLNEMRNVSRRYRGRASSLASLNFRPVFLHLEEGCTDSARR